MAFGTLCDPDDLKSWWLAIVCDSAGDAGPVRFVRREAGEVMAGVAASVGREDDRRWFGPGTVETAGAGA